MENRVAALAIIIAVIIAAAITTAVKPPMGEKVITEISETTITSTVTETLLKPTTITITNLVTYTKTSTITSVSTNTLTSTATSIVTNTYTKTVIKYPSINLVTINEDNAVSWSKTSLKILVNGDDAHNFNPDVQVVDAACIAVEQWKRSISTFYEDNPEYSYLGRLVLTLYIKGVNDTSLRKPDIEIKFTDILPSSLIGETKLLVTNDNYIGYAEITVGLKDLTLKGLNNVLIHEIGHALGLEHSSIENDVMYFEREKNEVTEVTLCPSTLDLYAIALIYQWIKNESYVPYNADFITLPEDIKYEVVACN